MRTGWIWRHKGSYIGVAEIIFLQFSVSPLSNVKDVFSTLCYLHSFRTINAHFIIIRGNSYVRFELIR